MSKKILVGCILFIFIWLSVLFQINFLNIVPLYGVSANIAIVVITSIGILAGRVPGILVGIVYGIIYDILFGKCFGIYLILYTLLGLASGELAKGIAKENKMSLVLMSALFTIVTEFLTYIIFVMIYHYDFELLYAIWMLIKETVYNMLLARILFKPLTLLAEIINKSKNSYYLL